MKNILATSFVFVLLSACTTDHATGDSKEPSAIAGDTITLTQDQVRTLAIETDTAVTIVVTGTVRATGIVEAPPESRVSVSIPLGGYLKHTSIAPGKRFRKGDVLAEFSHPEYLRLRKDFLQTRIHLESAAKEFQRQRELLATKATSDKQYDAARANFESLRVSLGSLTTTLKMLGDDTASISPTNLSDAIRVRAPFDGFAAAVHANIGKYLEPSDVVFELIRPGDYYVVLRIFQKDLSSVAIGQAITARTSTAPYDVYQGTVALVAPALGADGAAEVRARLNTTDTRVVPGLYMKAELHSQPRYALGIPSRAVVRTEGQHFVFVNTSPNRYALYPVRPGETRDSITELQDAAPLTSVPIVTRGAYGLLMALKVEW